MHTLDENYSVVPLTRLSRTQSPTTRDIPTLLHIRAKLTSYAMKWNEVVMERKEESRCATEWDMDGGGLADDVEWEALLRTFQREFESAKQKGFSMPKVKGAKRSSLSPVAEELKVRFVDYSYVLDFSLYSLRYCIMSDHSFYPSIFRLSSLSSLAAAFKTHASGTHSSRNLNCVVRHLLKVCFFFCECKINFSVVKCPTLPNIHFCPFMNDDRIPRCMPSQVGVSLGFGRMVWTFLPSTCDRRRLLAGSAAAVTR